MPKSIVSGKEVACFEVHDYQKNCFNNHLGMWMVEPKWFSEAIELYRAGHIKPVEKAQHGDGDSGLFRRTADGIAIIPISGVMMKNGSSKMGEMSTVNTRQAIRAATRSEKVRGIMVFIESPGGQVSGTQELADDIIEARKHKPVHAHFEDLGASAAVWVGVQAGFVSANSMAQVGSLGVFSVIHDVSGAFEKAGVKVHVISTGEQKGAFIEGTEVTKAQLAERQDMVDMLNERFKDAVMQGRGMSRSSAEAIFDGRVFIADKALELNLIDSVMSFDDAIANLINEVNGDLEEDLAARLRIADME